MLLFLEVIASAVIMSTAPPAVVTFLHSTLIFITQFFYYLNWGNKVGDD